MITINPYERAFQQASKNLETQQEALARNKEAQERLLKEENQIRERIKKQEEELTIKGMLYYNSEKRKTLLKQAEELDFSNETLKSLRSISENQWNQDFVGLDTINDFLTLEKYVNDNTPGWQKSFFSRLGTKLTSYEWGE